MLLSQDRSDCMSEGIPQAGNCRIPHPNSIKHVCLRGWLGLRVAVSASSDSMFAFRD